MNFQFQVDDDTKRLFEIATYFLEAYFNYSREEAFGLINTCYLKWQHIHDDDLYHDWLPFQIAVRVHYFEGLKGNPNEYYNWRAKENFNQTPTEAIEYIREHYFNYLTKK
jgi:hypothetical protein